MTALRMRARDFLSEDELIAVRERSTWKGAAMIVHAWALILGAIALVAWWPCSKAARPGLDRGDVWTVNGRVTLKTWIPLVELAGKDRAP